MKRLVSTAAVSLAGGFVAGSMAFAQTQPPGQFDGLSQPPGLTQPGAEPQGRHTVNGALPTPVFVNLVEGGTQFEIQAAQIALMKSQSPRIRQFAQRMIRDNGEAGEELHRTLIADPAAAQLQGGSMSPQLTEQLQQLQYVSGPDFDRTYVAMMLAAHEEDTRVLRDYARAGQDPRLKVFARRTLPVIEGHLRTVERLRREEQASR